MTNEFWESTALNLGSTYFSIEFMAGESFSKSLNPIKAFEIIYFFNNKMYSNTFGVDLFSDSGVGVI